MSVIKEVEILRAACCVAGLDGDIEPAESTIIDRLAERTGVGAMSLKAMKERAEADSNFYEEQFEVLKTDPERTVRLLLSVAAADGEAGVAERAVIGHMASKLGMEHDRFNEIVAERRG